MNDYNWTSLIDEGKKLKDLKFDLGRAVDTLLSSIIQEILFTQKVFWEGVNSEVKNTEGRYLYVIHGNLTWGVLHDTYPKRPEEETKPYRFLAQYNKLAEYIEKKYGLLAETNNGDTVRFTNIILSDSYPLKSVGISWQLDGTSIKVKNSPNSLKRVADTIITDSNDMPTCIVAKAQEEEYNFNFKMAMHPDTDPDLQIKVLEKLKSLGFEDQIENTNSSRTFYLFIYPNRQGYGKDVSFMQANTVYNKKYFEEHKSIEVDPYEFIGKFPKQKERDSLEAEPEFSDGPEFKGWSERSEQSRRMQYTGPTTKQFKKGHIYRVNEFGSNPNPEHIMHKMRDELGELTYILATEFKVLAAFVDDTTPYRE